MNAPTSPTIALLLPGLLAGCGGAGPSASDAFTARLSAPAPRTTPAPASVLAASAVTSSSFDAASGTLTVRQLMAAGGAQCFDAQLHTVAGGPARVELQTVVGSACSGTTPALYTASTSTLVVPGVLLVGSTSCFNLQLRAVSAEPVQLDLVSATPTACATGGSGFTLGSPVAPEGGVLPAVHTCDGTGSTLPLTWSNAPLGTRSFAVLMTTLPGDGSTKWNWVLHGIPASASGLAQDSFGVGTAGVGSDGPFVGYQPPCSQGPGAKRYTWTVYALSAPPVLAVAADKVTGAVLAEAIAPLTLASASLNLSYSRTAASPGSGSACQTVRSATTASTTGQATVSCDGTHAFIGSDGLATHTMMDGITATNLQVPIGQNFFGTNAWKIPLNPALAATTTSAVDGPIGVAINGVPIFNPCKQGGCQNGDTKVLGELDVCNGHAGRADDYHYHAAPTCLMAGRPASYWNTHPIGWALDGFAIFGYGDADGSVAQRDAVCGGNTKAVSNAPAGYSYHVTDASPYVLSCFRGTPSPDLAGQASKYAPLRKPPVTPFPVSGMSLGTDPADGYQVLQFSSSRSFVTTETGTDSYANPAGTYRIRYKQLTGEELDTLLAQSANRGKSACWAFQFGTADGRSTQPTTSYCR